MASKEESLKFIVDYEALGAAGVLEKKFISSRHGLVVRLLVFVVFCFWVGVA